MKKLLALSLILLSGLSGIHVSHSQSNNDLHGIYTAEETAFIKKRFEKTYVLYILAKYNFLTDKMYSYLNAHYDDLYQVLVSYDYIHGTKAYNTMIRAKKGAIVFLNNRKTTAQLHQMSIDQEYYAYLFSKRNARKGKQWIPKEFLTDSNFNYMIEGIKNDKTTLSHAKELAEYLGIESELALAGILTEQVRYALTERGEMKKFVSGVPMLLHLTKFSYGIGGIKSFTAEKIVKDALEYGYGDALKNHINVSGEGKWKDILINKYYQVAYPSYLIKNILTRWEKAGHPINKKPGVVITLYNFGNTEKKAPNANPQVGGADIHINNRTYNFGGLGEMFYWWMKIENPFGK